MKSQAMRNYYNRSMRSKYNLRMLFCIPRSDIIHWEGADTQGPVRPFTLADLLAAREILQSAEVSPEERIVMWESKVYD